jgi:hypothetical protein
VPAAAAVLVVAAGTPLKASYALYAVLQLALAQMVADLVQEIDCAPWSYEADPKLWRLDMFDECDWKALADQSGEKVDEAAWRRSANRPFGLKKRTALETARRSATSCPCLTAGAFLWGRFKNLLTAEGYQSTEGAISGCNDALQNVTTRFKKGNGMFAVRDSKAENGSVETMLCMGVTLACTVAVVALLSLRLAAPINASVQCVRMSVSQPLQAATHCASMRLAEVSRGR